MIGPTASLDSREAHCREDEAFSSQFPYLHPGLATPQYPPQGRPIIQNRAHGGQRRKV